MPLSAAYADVNTALGDLAFVPEVTRNSPNYKFRATGGSGTTTTVDTSTGSGTHDTRIASAADDFFNGLQLVFDAATSTSALQNQVYDITDFAVSGGTATFTTGTMAATPSAGDTFRVYGKLQVTENPTLDAMTDYHERNVLAQTLDPAQPRPGYERSSGSFELHLPGLVTPSTDGTDPGYDRYSAFLSLFGLRSVATGEATTGTSSTTTQIDVTDGTLFAVGDYVMINGEKRRVTAVNTAATPDNITLHRALSAAPGNGVVIYRPEIFTPYDDGHLPFTLLVLEDDTLHELSGAAYNLKYSGTAGQIALASVDFQGGPWTLTSGETLPGTVPAKFPIVFKASGALELSSTEIDISAFEFDLGHEIMPFEAVLSGVQQRIRGRKATFKATWRMEDLTPKNTWESGATLRTLVCAVGNAAGECVGIFGQVAPSEKFGRGEVAKTRMWDTTFGFYDNHDSSTTYKPILARF